MNNFLKKVFLIGVGLLFVGCASYTASSLSNLYLEFVAMNEDNLEKEEVVLLSKAFSVADCKKYLDRDVLRAGYQPVQIFIQNNTNKSFIFSPERVSLPLVSSEQVAEKVHTSTGGRAAAYGAGSLFFWPLLIPAVVDAAKSSEANKDLDVDFNAKAARAQVIPPHSHLNVLLFVSREDYRDNFSVFLVDQKTSKLKTLTTQAI